MAISGSHPNLQDGSILSMGEGFTPLEKMELGGIRFCKNGFSLPDGILQGPGSDGL